MHRALVAFGCGAMLVAGCSPCDSASPCPTPVSVRGFCAESRTCAIDGTTGWCSVDGCGLSRGQEVTIPVADFANRLGKVHDLYVGVVEGRGAGPPGASDVEAELDGVHGEVEPSPREEDPTGVIVTWTPFPHAPEVLTLRVRGSGEGSAQFRFEFQDARCEIDHPITDCVRR